jgi:hypothetical protein
VFQNDLVMCFWKVLLCLSGNRAPLSFETAMQSRTAEDSGVGAADASTGTLEGRSTPTGVNPQLLRALKKFRDHGRKTGARGCKRGIRNCSVLSDKSNCGPQWATSRAELRLSGGSADWTLGSRTQGPRWVHENYIYSRTGGKMHARTGN